MNEKYDEMWWKWDGQSWIERFYDFSMGKVWIDFVWKVAEKYHRHNMLFGREKNWWWLLLQFEEKVWAFTTKSMSNSTNCLLAHGKNEEKNEKIGCGGMEGKLNKHRKPASLWTASSSSFCVQTFSYNFHFTPSICVIFPQQISFFFFVFPLPDDDRAEKKSWKWDKRKLKVSSELTTFGNWTNIKWNR